MQIEDDFRLLESQYLDRAWQGIVTSVAVGGRIKPNEHLHYYTKVFDLCVANDAACQQLHAQVKQHLRRLVIDRILAPLKEQDTRVAYVLESWSQFQKYLGCLSRVFSYVDRFHVPLVQAKTISQLGFDIFKEVIYNPNRQMFLDDVTGTLLARLKSAQCPDVKDTIVAILDLVTLMEDGSSDSMQDLEAAVLQAYRSYYEKLAQVWIQDLQLYDYLQVTQETIVQEVAYFSLMRPLFKGLKAVLTEVFYVVHQGILLQNIATALYQPDAFPRSKSMLSCIYEVYSRLDGGVEAIAMAIYNKHSTLVQDNNVKEITEAFYDSCLVVQAMDASDEHLKDSMSRVFRLALEQPRVLISIFQNVDASNLAHLSWAYNLSRDKQHCLECYQACLAKRLLCNDCNLAQERRALEHLQQHAGKLYTLELDIMIQEAAAEKFKVFSSNKWPLLHDYKFEMDLDESFAASLDAFKADYVAQNNRKDLNWCYSASPVHVDVNGISVTCDLYQASVLLQLARLGKPTTLQELATNLSTSVENLQLVIQPMCSCARGDANGNGNGNVFVLECLRQQNLTQQGQTCTNATATATTTTTTLWFNTEFNGPANYRHVKIDKLEQEYTCTNGHVTTLVSAEAKLDCFLVAKLKTKVQMSQDRLVEWALEEHADINTTREVIIQRIQDLCRREYIKFDQERNTLNYVP